MRLPAQTIQDIKERITAVEPKAKIVLYGSYARGEGRPDSDIDLLILIDRPTLSYSETKLLTYQLYQYGWQTGQLLSPLVHTKTDWEKKMYFTPLFHSIQTDGVEL